MRPIILTISFLTVAACSGGSGDASATARAPVPGSVHVVVDTATGSDVLVQYLVGAAVFERADGTTTGNVLRAPEMVTFADPSGEIDGFALRDVPSGEYSALHLMLVPDGGTVQFGDGSTAPLEAAIDLEVPIGDLLQHDARGASWLALGHNGPGTVSPTGTGYAWAPALAARANGSEHELVDLQPLLVQDRFVTAALPAAGDGLLWLEFGPGAACSDDSGPVGAAGFLRDLRPGDDLRARAELRRDGRLLVREACRRRGNDGPRLIGRITELRPATTSFVLRVQAETRRGGARRLVSPGTEVLVLADGATIRRPGRSGAIAFDDLAVDDLAKVTWTERTEVPGGLDEFVAREVVVPGGDGAPCAPEWQGLVDAVDLTAGTITVVPRNDDPIVIDGQSVDEVTVVVDAETKLERRERHGPGREAIELDDIVPGSDRIWWRGEVTGPTTIAATWVRVRTE